MTTPVIAFIFPGQGSEHVGMGRAFAEAFPAARAAFDEADAAFAAGGGTRRLSEILLEGPADQLALAEYAQPAILAVSIAAVRVLEENGLRAAFVAGHGLGEYSANVTAGTIAFDEAVRIVRRRGRYMQEAVPAGTGGTPAAGEAFDSALMQAVEARLEPELRDLPVQEPRVPIVASVDAQVKRASWSAIDALVRQVSAPVRWQQVVERLASEGVTTYVEVGPGTTLGGLVKTIHTDAQVLHFGSPDDLGAVLTACST